MIVKLVTMLVCLLHVLMPVRGVPTWIILNSVAVVLLFHLSGLSAMQVLKRNILVISFALLMALFQLVTFVMAGTGIDYLFVSITIARIFFIYNMIMAVVAWMGRGGLLWLVQKSPSERLKLFLLLFARTVQMFLKLNRHIVFQLQSRIDTGSRKKYLVPRYYLQNLLAGEMYSLQHYQAGLLTRVHGPVQVLQARTLDNEDIPWVACVMLIMITGLVMVLT